MHVRHQLGKTPECGNEVVLKTSGVRRGKANALNALNLADGFKQLDERTDTITTGNDSTPIAGNYLPEKRNFLSAFSCEFAAFLNNLVYRATTLLATRL